MLNTPVVLIVFNRPRQTRLTFAAIRQQQPAQLFIIADGPRSGHPTDVERCLAVHESLAEIDWPCVVHRNYAEVNLGCKHRVISGLDWVFSQVDRAIVLEDDCLPHPDFFTYCQELLNRYASDERIYAITGDNFQDGRKRGGASYYFSKYNHVWGWATWRRAWAKNSPDLEFWPEWRASGGWRRHTPDPVERRYWSGIFDRAHRSEIDTWDYGWTASVWHHGGLTATPNANLVTNIGFGPDATHTVTGEEREGAQVQPLGVLTHPGKVERDRAADRYVFDYQFGGINHRLLRKILHLPRIVAGLVAGRFKP